MCTWDTVAASTASGMHLCSIIFFQRFVAHAVVGISTYTYIIVSVQKHVWWFMAVTSMTFILLQYIYIYICAKLKQDGQAIYDMSSHGPAKQKMAYRCCKSNAYCLLACRDPASSDFLCLIYIYIYIWTYFGNERYLSAIFLIWPSWLIGRKKSIIYLSTFPLCHTGHVSYTVGELGLASHGGRTDCFTLGSLVLYEHRRGEKSCHWHRTCAIRSHWPREWMIEWRTLTGAVPMVTMAQNAAYWLDTHTHMDRTHSLTHLHQHSYKHVHAGSFSVSVIHQTMTWTTGTLSCLRDHYCACVCTPTVSQHNIFDSEKLAN